MRFLASRISCGNCRVWARSAILLLFISSICRPPTKVVASLPPSFIPCILASCQLCVLPPSCLPHSSFVGTMDQSYNCLLRQSHPRRRRSTGSSYSTVHVLRMAQRKWKDTKQEPGTAGPGNMLLSFFPFPVGHPDQEHCKA